MGFETGGCAGMKTIIQSRKTRSFTYRQEYGEPVLNFLPFLMCFSLPDSNSFPGPRQLHINWPRRRCQGCSLQVLWCCHLQLNADLEVCSFSPSALPAFSPLSLISLFLCFVLSNTDVCFFTAWLLELFFISPPPSLRAYVCPSPSFSPFTGSMKAAAGPDWDQGDIHWQQPRQNKQNTSSLFLPLPLFKAEGRWCFWPHAFSSLKDYILYNVPFVALYV